MSTKITTIFEHDTNSGKIGILGIDEEARLYWNGQLIVTKQEVKFKWWVNISLIVGGISTAILAIFSILTYYCK
jgi:hypothetical protein